MALRDGGVENKGTSTEEERLPIGGIPWNEMSIGVAHLFTK